MTYFYTDIAEETSGSNPEVSSVMSARKINVLTSLRKPPGYVKLTSLIKILTSLRKPPGADMDPEVSSVKSAPGGFLSDVSSRGYSNLFFLCISIIQQLPGVSPMGQYTTVTPLVIILIVTGLKELYEDIVRHREDKKVNSRVTEVWKDDTWAQVKWHEIKVGEVIRVKNNLEFPADLLLVCCSDNSTGLAYVETVNLDGESNLKIRRVPFQMLDKCIDTVKTLRGVITCDKPNELIFNFNGTLQPLKQPKLSLSEDQIMLRGAILRNTDWILGIVIYTGIDTKISHNSRRKEHKKSSKSDIINWHMMVLFTVFVFLTIFNSIMYILWDYKMKESVWYLDLSSQQAFNYLSILTFAIGYSFMIPISLQIYLEVVQLVQASFINNDKKMFCKPKAVHAKAMTSTLNSDLGKVKYIFTDKTGTLTQNSLEFRKCSVNGEAYSVADIDKLKAKCAKNSTCDHFFLAICLCPGIIPVFNKNTKSLQYYASSPDHLALIQAAKMHGYVLKNRNYKNATVAVQNTDVEYEILADIEFTNERRRSTVVVRTPEKRIILYIMGSDDMIFSRLSNDASIKDVTYKHVVTFALAGLRTLCIAMVDVREDEFNKWIKLYEKAKLSLQSRTIAVARTAEKLERNLNLLGAVACEDKLQEEVPETIDFFIKAGIKVWMLTGDKQETAINIGYSTKLLSSSNLMFVLNSENIAELQRSCVEITNKMSSNRKVALVVNGNSLGLLLSSDFADYFITLSMNCDVVICCRMIPLMKAMVVNFVQNKTQWVTLAIGDGANDVAMIQTATVGVGVSGVEGLQAVHAADYSIAVFKHLKRLLFVHGTWNYNRVCKLIYYIYYKNIPIAITLLYLSSASGWSGSSFFDDWAFTLYNVLFTDGATVAVGIFEKDYSEEKLMTDYSIYKDNDWFDTKSFYICLINGIWHAIVMLFITMNMFATNTVWENGLSDHIYIQGHIVYTNILLLVLLKCSLHILHWTKFSVFFVIFTTMLWIPVLFIYSYMWDALFLDPDLMGMGTMIFGTPSSPIGRFSLRILMGKLKLFVG
ncbi:phospholipid-transporting ATPase IA-like [Planococcus citri]|uniref:phospholipid-transporting ATPase IA-like n=1 Tax=Planococcus citri TaxID=170843 RepID=UPI0031F7FAAA